MKKRMRKLISVIGVTVLAVSLFAGCGNSDQQGGFHPNQTVLHPQKAPEK